MKARVLESNRGNVHYWTTGPGPETIVFTHGATMDHGLFQYQIDTFSNHYRTIVWDVPSHGRSRPYEGFSMQFAADDLVRILEKEKIPKVHLVGQSMGGYISQIVGLNWPEKVLSITSVDSSPIQPSYYSFFDNFLLSITPGLLGLYPYEYLIKTISNQIAITDSAKQYALSVLKTYSKREISKIMKAVYSGIAVYKEDFRLELPVLIVYGDKDKSGKVQKYSKRWAMKENRLLRAIPLAAHNANMDNPEEFNRALLQFIEALKTN